MDDRKIIFALDIGTRSVVGIVGALKDDNFSILDYEQEFHEKRAMRDGQIEDIELVARVVNNVKSKLEQRSGQTFTKVSIAAAGRALKTASASYSYDLIPNEPITEKVIHYMEYSAIENAQSTFLENSPTIKSEITDYYCVGYSVTNYLLDDYKIKNLEGQKGNKAVVNIIAAFLPSSVLISLYAVTSRCNLEVDNLTLEPIAAIHSVVPDDVRFLNIALVDIGGGTSDIAVSRDGSIIAYDMVTIAGDEITEALMQRYLTNFATAEHIKLAMNGEDKIEFKDILGNKISVSPNEAFETIKEPINALADAISKRILQINGSAPAAVFLVGGGSQIRGLTELVADKLEIPTNRVAIGVVNTDNNLSLSNDNLYNPAFVTPIGIGIVSSLYRGCDFFTISVNGKRLMLFNHQTIKVIDALMFSGIKPSSLIGLSSPNLVYNINGVKHTKKGSLGTPGELFVNGLPATIETEIKQGDEITATLAKNGEPPSLTLYQALSEFDLNKISLLEVNGAPVNLSELNILKAKTINYMDQITVVIDPNLDSQDVQYQETQVQEQCSDAQVQESQCSVTQDSQMQNLGESQNLKELQNTESLEVNPVYKKSIQDSVVQNSENENLETLNTETLNTETLNTETSDAEAKSTDTKSLKLNSSEEQELQNYQNQEVELTSQDVQPSEIRKKDIEISKIYSHKIQPNKVSLLLADNDVTLEQNTDDRIIKNEDNTNGSTAKDESIVNIEHAINEENVTCTENIINGETITNTEHDYSNSSRANINVTLNGTPVHLVQETVEPLILMHLLKYVDLDVTKPRGELVLKINGHDANYADSLHDHDVAIIKWSEDM